MVFFSNLVYVDVCLNGLDVVARWAVFLGLQL